MNTRVEDCVIRVIPVLDIQHGRAVHAVGGRRQHYRPLASEWHPGTDPVALARALANAWPSGELYLADLDAIAGAALQLDRLAAISAIGLRLWVDAGSRSAAHLEPIFEAGASVGILGLESLDSPSALGAAIRLFGPDRVAFSLDLRDGRPLVDTSTSWGTVFPLEIARLALGLGCQKLIVLDLATVGQRGGPGSIDLIAELKRSADASVEWIAGGGVRHAGDLETLARVGVAAALVGTAIHEKRIPPGPFRATQSAPSPPSGSST